MSEPKNTQQSLDLNDLLHDDYHKRLSEHLRVSVSNDGQNTCVSVSTVDDNPVVYSSVFYGSKATDLPEILAEQGYFAKHNDG